jgi:signal transduction histidine kinase/CheY-like chemotaxis protein
MGMITESMPVSEDTISFPLFPSGTPLPPAHPNLLNLGLSQIESLRPRDLMTGRESVEANTCLDDVYTAFKRHNDEFMAVEAEGEVIGVCSRGEISFYLGSRYGFSIYGRRPVSGFLHGQTTLVSDSMPLSDLLASVLNRHPQFFYDDVIVVDDRKSFLGMISMRTLVQLQSRLVSQQIKSLQDKQREIEEKNRLITQREKQALVERLVGGIAHELNNKLMPVMGFGELLLHEFAQGSAAARQEEYVRRIIHSAQESAEIIQQLRQLSAPLTAEVSPSDLNELVQASLDMLQIHLRRSSIDLKLYKTDDPLLIQVNPGQIKQVITNLVINAMDAVKQKEQGRLEIATFQRNGEALLQVQDHGIGIRAEHLSKIFDPFFTTKGPQGGTGLGLTICYSIVQQFGGEITVKSVVGQGTTFTVKLPLSQNRRPPAVRSVETLGLPPFEWNQNLRPFLVIDDEDNILELVQAILMRMRQIRVIVCQNAREAQEIMKREPLEIVISDIRMPHLDGLQLYEWTETHCPHLTDRWVFMTGDEGSEAKDKLAGLKAPVLRKPFSAQQLLSLCRERLATAISS